ncbi:MAG: alpha-N-arabinofuranosidase, partial [Fibrella sp.]|nr:alpha-N-arabinofuranosidase [Armatimonadota bacterium]
MKVNLFISVHESAKPTVISPLLHGQFAEHLGTCIYDGVWKDGRFNEAVVEALAELRPPVLRWPGGCFADDYHWRDGIGPKEKRPRTVNIHWGYHVEDNSFGTHEFVELCRRIGAQPYFAGNVGSGTVQEFRNWIEYCNFRGDSTLAQERTTNGSPDPLNISWWGVGNEGWGCGGNFCPEDYAVEYKRYTTFLRDFPGAPLKLIACGPDSNNADWTRRFFGKLGNYARSGRVHGYAAHFYTTEWKGGYGTATGFSDEQFYQMLSHSRKVETLILQQRAIMDGWDPDRKITLILDEWGTWHHPGDTPPTTNYALYQQNAIRDALVAAMSLDIFHNQADKL